MAGIDKLKDKMPDSVDESGLSPEELEIRKRALAFQKERGMDMPEEPGIEELELEEAVPGGSYLGMVSPVGMGRKGAKEAAKHAPGLLRKLEMKAAPLFSDAVEKGSTKPGASSFAKFIRGESDEVVKNVPAKKPDVVNVPRFGTSDQVKSLMKERESLDLKTQAGRERLKEIDHMLKNRTYFKE